jgi:hypothetical protein
VALRHTHALYLKNCKIGDWNRDTGRERERQQEMINDAPSTSLGELM